MTHITISDRIWGIPVPNGVTGITISNDNSFIEWYKIWFDNGGGKNSMAQQIPLPPDKTYKFLCLASDIVLAHHAIKLTVDEIVDTCDRLDKDKEYALIEVQ